MDTNSTLNYRLYVQRQEEFVRADYHLEFKQYNRIKNGDVEGTRERFKIARQNFAEGRGVLSDNPLRNMIYHHVVAAAVISRVCIDGGMELDTAYTLSDIYIRKADKAKTPEEVLDITAEMQIDFATRMRELNKRDAISLHVRRSIDYIYDNLHRQVTVNEIAEREGLSPGYFSRLFVKEVGLNVNLFINEAKVKTAQNMLIYSEFSIQEIALSLGFSSQSAFSAVFKKILNMSPRAYREKYYNVKMTEKQAEK